MKQKAILPWHAETLKQSTWRIPALLAVTGVMFFWCLGRCGHNFWWSESRQQGPRPHPDWDTEMQLKHLDLTMSFWGLYCYCPIGKSSSYIPLGGNSQCECFFWFFFWGVLKSTELVSHATVKFIGKKNHQNGGMIPIINPLAAGCLHDLYVHSGFSRWDGYTTPFFHILLDHGTHSQRDVCVQRTTSRRYLKNSARVPVISGG